MVELAARLTDVAKRTLPALRLYSAWLVSNVSLLAGVIQSELLANAVSDFWISYAKVLDLLAVCFTIWELEEVSEVKYMLPEDVEVIAFPPLSVEANSKLWTAQDGSQRLKWSDPRTVQASSDVETLSRVKSLLSDGASLAEYDDDAPSFGTVRRKSSSVVGFTP